jgi:hypothetical protein
MPRHERFHPPFPVTQHQAIIIWAICRLVIETGHWFTGKQIAILPDKSTASVPENPKYS